MTKKISMEMIVVVVLILGGLFYAKTHGSLDIVPSNIVLPNCSDISSCTILLKQAYTDAQIQQLNLQCNNGQCTISGSYAQKTS